MKRSFSIADMRTADRYTIDELNVPSLLLMERAGSALADAVLSAVDRLGAEKALFVCGAGNNGGDGFVAARRLLEKGVRADVLCLATSFSADAVAVKKQFTGRVLREFPEEKYPVVVDCVLGTGLSRPPEGDAKALIEWINGSGAYVIAADIPSGLGENGFAFSPAVAADETVTMGLLKNALLLQDGVDAAGKVAVAEIGIVSRAQGCEVWEDGDVLRYFPKKKSSSHKGTYGNACIFAGINAYAGAPLLATAACLKSGVGYTKLVCADRLYAPYIGQCPAAVLRRYCGLDGEILSSTCLAVGMGAGVSEELYILLVRLLSEYRGTLVLDADALNALARFGVDVLKQKDCSVVVTPHLKEFSRLSGYNMDAILRDGVRLAQAFAEDFGVTVMLKSNRTVITDGERTAINPTGSACLAKGGSGDVLCGYLAGLCGRGIAPFEAACVSSYLLGRAGEIAAQEMGEYAPDASDIVNRLGRAQLSLASSE